MKVSERMAKKRMAKKGKKFILERKMNDGTLTGEVKYFSSQSKLDAFVLGLVFRVRNGEDAETMLW